MFLFEDWCKHQNILDPSKVFVCVFLFVFVFVFAKTLWQWSKADVAWFLSNARPSASKGYLFVFPHFASEHTWFTKSFRCRHPGSNCKKTWYSRASKGCLFCSSQPFIVHWLSSPIFPCLFVRRPAMVTSDQISTFFNIYRHKSVVLTQFHLIPSSTKLHWPSTTKYQPVPPHTDPVPPNTNQHRLLLSQYYHVSTSSASY